MKKIGYSKSEPRENLLACPFCGFEYNHIIAFEQMKGNDNYESGFANIRGDALVIYMECEEGHKYKIVFGEHKGWVYLFAEEGHR